MNTAQRRLLEAVDSLHRERRAPVPEWLIPVAVNAIGGAERDALVKRVQAMIGDALLVENRDHPHGAGIEVTATGRAALDGMPPPVEPVPTKPMATASEPTPATPPPQPPKPDRTAVIAEAAQKVRQRDDLVIRDHSPVLYDLLADMGGLVAERLRELRGSGNLEALGRWREIGLRIRRHTGGDDQ